MSLIIIQTFQIIWGPVQTNSHTKKKKEKTSWRITQTIHSKFSNVFTGIGYFQGKFLLLVREGSHLYQVLARRVTYALQEPLKEDLEWLQKQQIIVPLDVFETSEWCNSFILVPKANGKVWLCLHPASLNKVLKRILHRVPTLNDILPMLAGINYLTLIDASSGYHNLETRWITFIINYIFLSIWWEQMHMTAAWGGTSWWHVSEADQWAIPCDIKCTSYCQWHSNGRVWYPR